MKQRVRKIINNLGVDIIKLGKIDDTDSYYELYGEESIKNYRLYNISAGGHAQLEHVKHPLWTKVDVNANTQNYFSNTYIDHDILDCKPLPIDSERAEIILSQYAVEHIPDSQAEFFFEEAYRALRPNGVLRIVAPNADLDYLAYVNQNRSHFIWENWMGKESGFNILLKEASFEQLFIAHFAGNASEMHVGDNPNKLSDKDIKSAFYTMSKEEFFDFCTSKCSIDVHRKYRSNHINWWNHEKLTAKLKGAGFTEVYSMGPHQSSVNVLKNNRYFGSLWNEVALYIEAIKR